MTKSTATHFSPRRILFIGNFQRKRRCNHFYETSFIVENGLIRAGHFVLTFSLRDEVKQRRLAAAVGMDKKLAMKQLLGLIDEFDPEILLFDHVDLLDKDDFALLKERAKKARFVQYHVDSTKRASAMNFFSGRTEFMDVSFITSALDRKVEAIFPQDARIAYMPNPVDAAIERGQAFAHAKEELKRDFHFLGGICSDRVKQLDELRLLLPSTLRSDYAGAIVGKPDITGNAFLDYISGSAMSPSLQPESGVEESYLYASTRVAQQMACGVLTFVHASTKLDDLYADGVVLFRDIEHLGELVSRYHHDDEERRRLAQIGWQSVHEQTNTARVCQYMLDVLDEREAMDGYGWPSLL
nr:glycosyltransferase [uncultured Cohaesibacter sp.]